MTTTAPGHTEGASLAALTHPPARSRLGAVIAFAGVGLLMQGVADALARNGDTSTGLALFLLGMALLFGVCAWRLTGAPAGPNERLLTSLVLGLGLLASYLMRYPLLLTQYDELQHRATLSHLFSSHALFPTNSLLVVSPYYPGLELATAATRWLTGLPLTVDCVIVLIAVRVLLVLAVFLVVERACGSARAGGVGALVYMANPAFYAFDSMYAYETMALALGAATIYLLFVSIDRARPDTGRLFVLALCTIAAVLVTHHLTGWLTVGFVVVWAIGLALRSLRGETPALRIRRRAQARLVVIAAAVGVMLGTAWTLFVGSRLTEYLSPIFSAAYSDIISTLGNFHGSRRLFVSASGGVSPTWDIALLVASAIAWCLILVPSLYEVVFKRSVRGGALRYLPAVIAATYPLLLLANYAPGSKAVAGRATEFTFFGVAVVVGAWVAGRIVKGPRWPERLATIAVAILCAVGSLLFGIGPIAGVLPGPYQVGGDQLSLGSPSLAVAHWADMNIPAGTNVAADRDNGVLLNAIAGVNPVTPEANGVNAESLYFDRKITPYDLSLLRQADIRYVFVDDRLTQGSPLYGVDVAAGEPQTRLTLEQLNKFASYPGVRRVYDNGPIKVYDVAALLRPSERSVPTNPPDGAVGSGVDVGVFLLALVVAALWVLRLLRLGLPRRARPRLVVCTLVMALLLAIGGAFVVRVIHVPPEAAAVTILVVLAGLSFWPPAEKTQRVTEPRRILPSRTQVLLGLAGGALLLGGAWVATVASQKEWTPPPELALVSGARGHPVAQVQLGSAGPIAAEVLVSHDGRLVWGKDIAKTTTAQHVELPAIARARGSRVALVSNGKALRIVGYL
jgi:hypothetical protein